MAVVRETDLNTPPCTPRGKGRGKHHKNRDQGEEGKGYNTPGTNNEVYVAAYRSTRAAGELGGKDGRKTRRDPQIKPKPEVPYSMARGRGRSADPEATPPPPPTKVEKWEQQGESLPREGRPTHPTQPLRSQARDGEGERS